MGLIIESPHPPCICNEYGVGEKYQAPVWVGRVDDPVLGQTVYIKCECPKHGACDIATSSDELLAKLPPSLTSKFRQHARSGSRVGTRRWQEGL